MQYPQVVSWVNGFVSDMRQGDPATVLLSKASAWRDPDEGSEMPVALVEKAAQIFNQGMVLENMSQGRRGETQNLIDIDQLVADYVAPHAKAAAAPSFVSPAISTSLPNFNFSILSSDGLRKAAAVSAPDKAEEFVRAEVEPNVANYEQVVSELRYALHQKAAAWTRDLLQSDMIHQEGRHCVFPGFGRIEADAVRMEPWMAKAADWIVAHWSTGKSPVTVTRATAADREMHKLAHDYTGHASRLLDIGQTLAEVSCALEFLEEEKAAAGVIEEKKKKAPQKPGGEGAAPAEGGSGTPPPVAPSKPGKPAPAAGSIPSGAGSAVKLLKLEPTAEPPKSDGEKKPEKGEGGKPGLVGQVLNMGGNGAAALIQKVLAGASAGGGMNTRQRKIDESVQGLQELQGLQKLMQTDPVISKADPQMVAEIFATIRRGAPSIAADPALLRFQMREALQYGGLPTEGYGQLTKIRGMENDNSEAERRDDQAAYAIRPPAAKAPPTAKKV